MFMKLRLVRLVFFIVTTFCLVGHPFFSQPFVGHQTSVPNQSLVGSSFESRMITLLNNDSSHQDRINQPLPGTQISQAAVGFMIFGSILTLGGISLLGVSLYQREQSLPDWQTFTGIGTGMSLAGLTFLVLGISTNPRYNERPVALP
jgi:hypothetical protein